jgi:hypothetical protein
MNANLLKRLALLAALAGCAVPVWANGSDTVKEAPAAATSTAATESAPQARESVKLCWDRVGSPFRWV